MKTFCLLMVSALAFVCRVSADVVAPSVSYITITPAAVDINASDQPITLTMRITDDDSGFEFGNLFLYNQAGDFVNALYFDQAQRTSGNALDGIYTMTAVVPRYAAPGTWRVDALVEDVELNRRNIGPENPDQFAVPTANFTVANDTVDSVKPVFTSASVTPESVDVTNADATLTFTIECGDALSGFDYGLIYPNDPEGAPQYPLIKYFSTAERISGTGAQGVYQVEFTLPEGSMIGDWTFDVFLRDRVGNSSFHPVGSVAVSAGPQPPPLATRAFLAQAVDAIGLPWSSGGSGWVMNSGDSHDGIDAAMSQPIGDNGQCTLQTTVTGPGTISFQWRVDSEVNSDYLSVSLDGSLNDQISGLANWSPNSVTIPAGIHTVTWRYAKDGSGSSNGSDRGWVDEVRFQRTTDESLPQLQDLRISPRSLDLADGPADVTLQIEVTDDFNGLFEGRVELFDPSGNPRISTSFSGDSPEQGDAFAGTYEVVLTVPDDAGSGLWRAEITLTEANSNATRRYGGLVGEAYPVRAIETFYAGNIAAADVAEPVVHALDVTPGTVDVSASSQTATVTLQITDTIAGFNSGNVSVMNPMGGWTGAYYIDSSHRISGDPFNGIYQVQVAVPRYGSPGSWSIACYVTDNNGNDHEYPYNLAFPSDVRENFNVTNNGIIDVTDPVITSIDVTPAQINTSGGSAQIQITVAIQDDVSGLLQAYAYFYNPADEYQAPLIAELNVSNRINGNEFSGTYQFARTLPQGSAVGQWKVRVFIRDKSGRSKFYGQNAEPYPDLGDGFFTIGTTPVSLYQAFIATYSLVGGDAQPGADPDHDGRNNATELMLGTNPSLANSSGNGLISLNRDASHLHLDFTVHSGLSVTANGGFLELRDGGGGDPLLLKGQTHSGLTGTWTDTTPVPVSGTTYRVSLPLSSGPKGFLRLLFETR